MLFIPALKYISMFFEGMLAKDKVIRLGKDLWVKYFVITVILWYNLIALALVPTVLYTQVYGESIFITYVVPSLLALYTLGTVHYGIKSDFFKKIQIAAAAMPYEERKARSIKNGYKYLLYYCAPFAIAALICVLLHCIDLI